jgi:deferrochelatase/peroxidase EfeB
MSKKENPSSRKSTFAAARKLGQMLETFEKKPGEDMIEFIRGDKKIAEALVQGAAGIDIARSEEKDK